jgi:RNA polymerase sigma-70 factor (sigma-E family)
VEPPGELAAGLRQTAGRRGRYLYVDGEMAGPGGAVAARRPARVSGHGHGDELSTGGEPAELDAAQAVAALYESHALALIRLAYLMLGDRHAAEDVVQDAFSALYRAWHRLRDHRNLPGYVRACVVNGCRSAHRRARRVPVPLAAPDAASAESEALAGEEQRATIAAVNRLPPRQREAIVLRFYAGLPEREVALAMGVSRGTVKSTTARALAALGRILREEQ